MSDAVFDEVKLAGYSDRKLSRLFWENQGHAQRARCRQQGADNVYLRREELLMEEARRRGLKLKDGLH